MNQKALVRIAIPAAFLGGGWYCGNWFSAREPPPNVSYTPEHRTAPVPGRDATDSEAADHRPESLFDMASISEIAGLSAERCRERLIALASQRRGNSPEALEIWNRLGTLDPPGAFQLLLRSANEDSQSLAPAAELILRTWARDRPKEALTATFALPGGAVADRLRASILNDLLASNPQLAVELSQEVSGSTSVVFSEWAKIDPIAALTCALSDKRTPLADSREVESCILAWSKSDAKAATDWIATSGKLRPSEKDNALGHALPLLARRDPELAAATLSQISNPQSRLIASQAILRVWEPQQALLWADRLEDGPMRIAAISTIAQRIAASDPDTALALSEEIPGRQMDREVFRSFAASRLSDNAADTMDWAVQVTDPFKRDSVLDLFATALPVGDLTDWIASHPDSELPPGIFGKIATRMLRNDRQSALQWAESLPPGPAQEQALRVLSPENPTE